MNGQLEAQVCEHVFEVVLIGLDPLHYLKQAIARGAATNRRARAAVRLRGEWGLISVRSRSEAPRLARRPGAERAGPVLLGSAPRSPSRDRAPCRVGHGNLGGGATGRFRWRADRLSRTEGHTLLRSAG